MKDEHDKISIEKDIAEREQIIVNYKYTRKIDREDVINKIKELRSKDAKVAVITMPKNQTDFIPFECVTDEMLVMELDRQRKILYEELLEKQGKKNAQ